MRESRFYSQHIGGVAFAVAVLCSVSTTANGAQGVSTLRATAALMMAVSLDLDEVPLRMAVETLAQQAGVSVTWDETALAELNLPAEETIAMRTRQKMPLRKALRLVLEPLHLAFEDQGDSLLITSRQRWDQRVVKVSYGVRDIVSDQFSVETLAEIMAEVLTDNAAAGAWQRDNPSQSGYMSILDGTLRVTHRREVQRELAFWLNSLRVNPTNE